MINAILLDGTANPVCIRLNDNEASEYKSARKKSMSWAGSAESWRSNAETPPKYFNFTRIIDRKDQGVKEVLVFTMVGLREDQLVPGLRTRDLDVDAEDAAVTVKAQGEILAEQFLYPEKYAHMGRIEVAAA